MRRGDRARDPVAAELAPGVQDALWRFLGTRGRGMFRRARTGVVLRTPDGRETVAVRGAPTAVLAGEPGELVLVAFGRGARALVERGGDTAALAALAAADLSAWRRPGVDAPRSRAACSRRHSGPAASAPRRRRRRAQRAGKTTFAAALRRAGRELATPRAAVVHLDDLYPGWDGLDAVVPLLTEHLLAPLAQARG